MTGIRSIDEQLHDLAERRETAQALLSRCLVEIDAMSQRIDVLLERRANGEIHVDQTDQMT